MEVTHLKIDSKRHALFLSVGDKIEVAGNLTLIAKKGSCADCYFEGMHASCPLMHFCDRNICLQAQEKK